MHLAHMATTAREKWRLFWLKVTRIAFYIWLCNTAIQMVNIKLSSWFASTHHIISLYSQQAHDFKLSFQFARWTLSRLCIPLWNSTVYKLPITASARVPVARSHLREKKTNNNNKALEQNETKQNHTQKHACMHYNVYI